MKVKIFKSANQISIMDVNSALDYYKKNKYGEEIYKGSILFLINEYKGSRLVKTAFVPKAEAKYICREVLNNSLEIYEHFGGSIKNGAVIARVFSIKKIVKNNGIQFVFEITEGPGYKTSTGGYNMTKNSGGITRVQKFLNEKEMKIMAGELLDFIHQSENLALQKNRPLYTIIESQNYENNYQEQQMDDELFEVIPNTTPTNQQMIGEINDNQNYMINIGGEFISVFDLTVEQLSLMILKIEPINDENKRIIQLAKFALAKKQNI